MASNKDEVYLLGDAFWRDHKRYKTALHGSIHLIRGSHDAMSQDCLRLFASVSEGMLIRNFNKIPFVLTHCAMLVWERSHYGAYQLHGHSHARIPETDDRRRMDVGMDAWGCKLVPLDLIIQIMQKRTYGYKGSGDEVQKNVGLLQARNKQLLEEFNDQRKLS